MIIIVMGVSGCGKTTIAKKLAEKLNWEFFEGDQYHPPENIARMSHGVPLTDQDRAIWLTTLANLISDQLQSNQQAVLACSALKQKYRLQLAVDQRVRFVYLKVDQNSLLQRLQQRGDHFMKPDMLVSQLLALEEPADAITLDANEEPEKIVEKVIMELFPSSDRKFHQTPAPDHSHNSKKS